MMTCMGTRKRQKRVAGRQGHARRGGASLLRIGVALGIAALAGCAQAPPAAVKQIEQARQRVTTGDYAGGERLLSPVIAAYAQEPGVAEAYYLRGQCRLKSGQRHDASSDLKKGLVLANDRALQVWIEVQLANMAYDDGKYERARFFYELAADDLPERTPSDRALYQYGVALQRTQRFKEARQVFGEVYRRFPSSEYASYARRKQSWTDDYFTVQCGVFSDIARAHRHAAKLREVGINALAVPDPDRPRERYIVRVGRMRSYAQAEQMLERVRVHQPDAFIVP
jgi:TolA-binding protein